jgi:hydrogenase expression/formation protein HypC
MCLAVPGKIVEIEGKYALVDFNGVKKRVNILLTPAVKRGDWVIVHTGFALQKLSKELKEYEILLKR